MSRGKAAIGPDGGQKILNRDSSHKPNLSTRVFHPAKSPARDPSQTFSPCHRLLPVNDALAAKGLVASDVITLACLPNGLLASSSGDSTSSSGIRTTPMPSAGVLRPDSCKGPLWRMLACTKLTNLTFSAAIRAQKWTLSGS
jgi:hypothetical protein